MFKAYDRILRRHPIGVQAVTTAGLFVLGDVIAQQVVEKKMAIKSHDFGRSAKLGAFGLCLAGPCFALWYPFLQRSVKFNSEVKNVVGRVFLDQTVFAPTFIALFISSTTLMNGGTVADVKSRLNEGYMEVLMNNWKIWPAVQLINFAIVPVIYRSLVVNTLATGWNAYLSLLSARLNEKSE